MSIFKDTKIDRFIGGVIFGALLSLFINILTFTISDTVTKQRALESIENEIASNTILGNVVVASNNKLIANRDLPNIFNPYHDYSLIMWNNPSVLQYIQQLDPGIQSKIAGYYQITIPYANQSHKTLYQFFEPNIRQCSPLVGTISASMDKLCKEQNSKFLSSENSIVVDVVNRGIEILKDFHPTKDRLKNPFLVILMGDKAIGALKVSPKLK